MDYPNHITSHEKGKHLTYEDYVVIELRLKDGWKPNAIAKKELNCSANTVRNIIKKGMTPLYNGKIFRFKAKTAWKVYQENRRRSCRTYEALEKRPFLQYVAKHFQEDKWSLGACVGRALEEGRYDRSEMLCTKTLYNYVDLGLLHIKNIDLPQKLSRNTKIHKDKENKRVLGRSIEERPDEVDTREEFGHWKTDLVIGQKSGKDDVHLAMLERKTRDFSIIRLPDKSADSVLSAFQKIQSELGDYFIKVFRSITMDIILTGCDRCDSGLCSDTWAKICGEPRQSSRPEMDCQGYHNHKYPAIILDSFCSRIPYVNIHIQCLYHEGVEEAPTCTQPDDQRGFPQGVGTGQITGSVEHSGVRLPKRNAFQQPITGSHQYPADCTKNTASDKQFLFFLLHLLHSCAFIS